jgi:hypothetical protein
MQDFSRFRPKFKSNLPVKKVLLFLLLLLYQNVFIKSQIH